MSGRYDTIVILDFGAQYTQLIARRVREAHVRSVVMPFSATPEEIAREAPVGIILSGGPSSVYDPGAPLGDPAVLRMGVPTLGLCYGMQWMAQELGGGVTAAPGREYGRASVQIVCGRLFAGLGPDETVWMSHGDHVSAAPAGFRVTAKTASAPIAGFEDVDRKLYAIQFHPEVHHTEHGSAILENFLYDVCGAKPTWTMASFRESAIARIREAVTDGVVLGALSGGVDSTVAAVLIREAVGERFRGVFVDTGLMRKDEAKHVLEAFRHLKLPVTAIDASDRFLSALAGVTEPERKRKVIGGLFIDVFTENARAVDGAAWLAQGTLYPDVIESVSFKGPSAVIKSHHNVGGLPEHMKLKLIEPLRELFKDEVRACGDNLGMPRDILMRQPFPGPGLAIRCLGEITPERLAVLRAADHIVSEEIRMSGLLEPGPEQIWQSFCVLLPVKSVGVMGDHRTYEETCAIRAVRSLDGMTADWAQLPYELLGRMSNRIINEVRGINRVVYDISSKPPATIEWE